MQATIQNGANAPISNNGNETYLNLATDLIREVDFRNKELIFNIILNSIAPLCKVLKITNCPTLNDAKLLIAQDNFYQKVKANPSLFVIIIEVLQANNGIDSNSESCANDSDTISCFDTHFTKPMIIQITSSDRHSLFFKERIEDSFVQLSIDHFADENNDVLDDLEMSINDDEQFNFEFIMKLLNFNIWGKFSFDLTQVEINVENNASGARLIDWAVQHGKVFCLKFLILFDRDLNLCNDDGIRTLEVCAEYGTLEMMKIVLDLPDIDDQDIILNRNQIDALSLVNARNQKSVSTIAAESENFDIVKFLLEFRLNLDEGVFQNLSNLALKIGNYCLLVAILKADGRFPDNFDINIISNLESEDAIALKDFHDERNSFHKSIKYRNCEEFFKDFVKFTDRNPGIRCGYNHRNQSVLETALNAKAFRIYAFLKSKGFRYSNNVNDLSHHNKMSLSDKQALRDANREFFKSVDNKHIMELLSISHVGFGGNQKNFDFIKGFYETLNEIPEIQPILKIVANAKNTNINYDFNRHSIADLDPTKTEHTRGTAYHNSGQIYVGAKHHDLKRSEVLGTLAHEFTHYAMNLTYSNNCKPFYANDTEKRESFEKIVRAYDNDAIKGKEIIVKNAFENILRRYPFETQVVELIVRVPHLFALYNGNYQTIEELKTNFKDLFDFYTRFTLKDVISEHLVMRPQRKIYKLNQLTGVFAEVSASKIYCQDMTHIKVLQDKLLINKQPVLISCQVPSVVLTNLCQYLKDNSMKPVDVCHIFIEFQQLCDDKFVQRIQEAFHSEQKPTIFVLNSSGSKLTTESLLVLSQLQIEDRFVLITNADSSQVESFFREKLTFDYQWNDLHQKSQDEILNYQLYLQGTLLNFRSVFESDFTLLQQLSLAEVLQIKTFDFFRETDKIASIFQMPFYIERQFIVKVRGEKCSMNVDKFLDSVCTRRVVILADAPGMGKSTSLHELSNTLRERNVSKLVFRINLKQHLNCFNETFNQNILGTAIEINQNFISKKLLNLKDNLEQKLFAHFHQSGKIIFLFDGFDEISPNYKSFVLQIFQFIRNCSNNQLWIATRLHLVAELESTFNESIISLKPFSEQDQMDFLIQYLTIKTSVRSQESVQEFAQNLLKKFKFAISRINQEDFLGIPLQLRMLAEIYDDLGKQFSSQNIDLFTFYEFFVKKMVKILPHKGSIEYFFKHLIDDELDLPEISESLTIEMVLRVGIYQKNQIDQFEFIHQTFAEFFIADFLQSNIICKTRRRKSKAFHNLLFEVLLDQKYKIVRRFLSDKLNYVVNILPLSELSKSIKESLNTKSDFSILDNLIVEENFPLITFLLEKLNLDHDTKLQMIQKKNKNQDTILHIATSHSCIDVLDCLWQFAISAMSNDIQKSFLCLKDAEEMNVLSRATFDRNPELHGLKFILDKAEQLLNSEDLLNLLLDQNLLHNNALHQAVSRDNSKAFEILWTIVEKNLDSDAKKQIFYAKGYNDHNILISSVASSSIENVESVLNKAKQFFTHDDFKLFVNLQEVNGNTALHKAALHGTNNTFKSFWNLLACNFDEEFLKSVWTLKGRYANNLLMFSINNDDEILNTVLKISTELFSPVELKEFLTFKNDFDRTVLHTCAERSLLNAFIAIWNVLKKSLDNEEIKQLLGDLRFENTETQTRFNQFLAPTSASIMKK